MKKILKILIFILLIPSVVFAGFQNRYSYNLVKKNYITNDVVEYAYSSSLNDIQLNGVPSLYNKNNVSYDFLRRNASVDNRFKVNPRVFPYSAVGMVESIYENNNGQLYSALASGVLIGPDLVFTAAHAVYDYDSGAWAKSVYFYPGKIGNGSNQTPYSSGAISISIPQSYYDTRKDDWALLIVDEDFSDLGMYGFNIATNSLLNTTLYSSGYSGDKNGEQWSTSGIVRRIGDNYQENNSIMDLEGIYTDYGHSGAPIYNTNFVVFSNYTFGGGYAHGGGRAIDSNLYSVLYQEYNDSIIRYPLS